jgi:hypothetical protein
VKITIEPETTQEAENVKPQELTGLVSFGLCGKRESGEKVTRTHSYSPDSMHELAGLLMSMVVYLSSASTQVVTDEKDKVEENGTRIN